MTDAPEDDVPGQHTPELTAYATPATEADIQHADLRTSPPSATVDAAGGSDSGRCRRPQEAATLAAAVDLAGDVTLEDDVVLLFTLPTAAFTLAAASWYHLSAASTASLVWALNLRRVPSGSRIRFLNRDL
ncbi:hypothetical protein HPB52_016213 [Rhipicephalus sanguineus]|uniref:Uncharacterized protein n=1 Tax=Rhipicephalus sanguineus TaxID=34632 RepID=A0A9D4SZK2_RHISA|nr:hypothetical protein HPB52_016213 [Rhipicephalus sanguineus]